MAVAGAARLLCIALSVAATASASCSSGAFRRDAAALGGLRKPDTARGTPLALPRRRGSAGGLASRGEEMLAAFAGPPGAGTLLSRGAGVRAARLGRGGREAVGEAMAGRPIRRGVGALAAVGSVQESKAYDGEQLRLLDADECILVNEKDEVVGSASKKFCHLMANIDEDKALHRAFSVFLFTGDGELVLQKRSSDKILFPDRWTNTVCSHPLHTPDELDNPPCPEATGVRRAAVRKLEHELGIPQGQVPASDLHFMTRIVYKAAVGEDDTWGEHEVDYILVGKGDASTPGLNPNEVSEVRMLKRGELEGLLEEEVRGEVMLSPWFKLIAQRWLPKWWDAVLEGDLLREKDSEAIHKLP